MPCQILVKRLDNQFNPSDPDAVCWRRGDPVTVRDTSEGWGLDELPEAGKFFLVELTDRTAAQIKSIIESFDEDGNGNPVRMRLYEFRISDLSASDQAALESTGMISMNFQTARAYVRNKRTGQTI